MIGKKNYEDKKLLNLIIINIILLSIGHALNQNIIVLLSLICFIALVLLNSDDNLLPIILFYLPWSPIMKTTPNSFSFHTIIIPIFLIYILISNNKEYKLKILLIDIIIVISIIILTLTVKLFSNTWISKDYIIFMMMLLFVPTYLRTYRDKLDFEKCIMFLTIGIITAYLFSNILIEFPHMKGYINVYEWEQIGLVRRSGFYSDSNIYTIHILISIAGLLIILVNKGTKEIIYLLTLILALIYCGMISVSKMFILLLVIIFTCWLFSISLIKGKIDTKIIIILGIVTLILLVLTTNVFKNRIDMYLIRFNQINNIENLTSGRSEIWKSYIDILKNNILLLIFGNGYSGVGHNLNMAAHNTFIQIVYEFGILGAYMANIWIQNINKVLKINKNINIIKAMLLIILCVGCFGTMLSIDMLFFADIFYIIMIFFIGKKYIIDNRSKI